MRQTLTLNMSPFLLAICATCLGLSWSKVYGQDPTVIFGNSSPPAAAPASAPAKASVKHEARAAAPSKSAVAPAPKNAPAAPSKTHIQARASAPAVAKDESTAQAQSIKLESVRTTAKPHTKHVPSAPLAEPAAPAAEQAAAGQQESPAAAAPGSETVPAAIKSAPGAASNITPRQSVKTMPVARPASRPAAPPVAHRPAAPPMPSRAAISNYCGRQWMKVNTNWDLPAGRNHVILGVDVDASGAVVATQISSHPKNAEAEAKAQEALTKSQPLDALPTGLPSAHLTITFDSTADPHGDSSSNGSVNLQYNPSAPTPAPATAAPANSGAAGGPTPTE